jgi:hypothetical protein
LAALFFFIIFLDLSDLGIYACGRKQQANGKNANGGRKNQNAKPFYLAIGGIK